MTITDEGTTEERAAEFTGRVLSDTGATTTLAMSLIGDQLGLFRALADAGPATSAELARRTHTHERYVREWLAAMNAAGYLTHDAADHRFTLPPEHRPTLVDEPGPSFLPGVQQEVYGALIMLPQIMESFRSGGGVPHDAYPDDLHVGVDRFTTMWHQHLLTQVWIPLIPDAETKLKAGCRVADVGCGSGRALVRMAQEYPGISGVGYDVHGPSIDRAHALAEASGVGDRVSFEVRDASSGLPEQYDMITTFDVVHDAVDPKNLLRSIREALSPGGVYLCLDINCADEVDDNVGPVATLLYGFSVLYCMTCSLAHDGEGLGTMGLTPKVLQRLARDAGFQSVRRVEMENPFNNLYELRR